MVGSLPALFGRVFLIGYLIPAVAILVAAGAIVDFYECTDMVPAAKTLIVSSDEKVLALRIGIFVAVAWVFAVLLMVCNLALIQLLEGYGKANPARLIRWRIVRLFKKLSNEKDDMDKKRLADGSLPPELLDRYGDVLARLGNEFPEEESLLLSTRFGNILRAFERYPQVIYGIDAINAWGRLQAVLRESYCTLLDEAKAQLDFWVNLWFGGLLIAALHLGLLVWTALAGKPCAAHSTVSGVVIPPLAVAFAIIAAKLAQSAAAQWGVLVKGAFDLYRGELCRQMGLEMPRSIEHERRMWTAVAQTMLYRLPRYADKLTIYRPLEPVRTKATIEKGKPDDAKN
jgi:hypothetical protein